MAFFGMDGIERQLKQAQRELMQKGELRTLVMSPLELSGAGRQTLCSSFNVGSEGRRRRRSLFEGFDDCNLERQR
jgi:hypothetical protein